MLTNPTPLKESISKRMMAGVKVPQLSADEVIELTLRVQSLLINHFGPGGFVVQETMAMLNETLISAIQNDWADAVRGPQALLKQNTQYLNLLGALLFGIEAGARPRFDPNGTLEYQILSVVQHLRYEMRPHDWSSIGAPHNWTFYLSLLQNVICIANAYQLSKQFDMNKPQDLYDVKERFIEEGLQVSGNEKLMEVCIDQYTDIIKEEEKKGAEELRGLETMLKKIQVENEEKMQEIDKYKQVNVKINNLVKQHEIISQKVLLAKNQQVVQINENETAKEMLATLQVDLQIALSQLNYLQCQLKQEPFTIEENRRMRNEFEHRGRKNGEDKRRIDNLKDELNKIVSLQKKFLPMYRQVLKSFLELVGGIEVSNEVAYSEEVQDVLRWAHEEERNLRKLDEMIEDTVQAVDFEALKLFIDNFQCVALPAIQRAIQERKEKNEGLRNVISQMNDARAKIWQEIEKLSKKKESQAYEVQEFQNKNQSQLGILQKKIKEYGLKILKEENETREKALEVDRAKDEERHLQVEVEMMVREMEMLQKKQNREIQEARKAVHELYEFVDQEWEDEEDYQLKQMQRILQLFAGLGREGIKACETWMINQGFAKDWVEEMAPQFKSENFS